jgi:hypothetical protein
MESSSPANRREFLSFVKEDPRTSFTSIRIITNHQLLKTDEVNWVIKYIYLLDFVNCVKYLK